MFMIVQVKGRNFGSKLYQTISTLLCSLTVICTVQYISVNAISTYNNIMCTVK